MVPLNHDRIISDSKIMMGKPVICGTRITVELILRLLGWGHTVEVILDAYPNLTAADIHAAYVHGMRLAKAGE